VLMQAVSQDWSDSWTPVPDNSLTDNTSVSVDPPTADVLSTTTSPRLRVTSASCSSVMCPGNISIAPDIYFHRSAVVKRNVVGGDYTETSTPCNTWGSTTQPQWGGIRPSSPVILLGNNARNFNRVKTPERETELKYEIRIIRALLPSVCHTPVLYQNG